MVEWIEGKQTMLSDREAYAMLGHYEGIAITDGMFVKDLGVAKLTIKCLGRFAFEYVWGTQAVEKHLAVSAVKTFGQVSR